MNLVTPLFAIALVFLGVFSVSGHAADNEFPLVIKGHQFIPAEVKVPAGQKVKLIVHNQDDSAEEFESHSLNREKVIAAGAKVTIFIGPLTPGRYPFYGEFNEKSAQGVVIVE